MPAELVWLRMLARKIPQLPVLMALLEKTRQQIQDWMAQTTQMTGAEMARVRCYSNLSVEKLAELTRLVMGPDIEVRAVALTNPPLPPQFLR